MTVAIATYRPEHAGRFAELNSAYLVEHGLLEPADLPELNEPKGHFLDPGGEIYVACDGAKVVGTCAIVPHQGAEWKIAKLVVDPAYHRQGIARRLVERCLAHARERGVQRLVLTSNSQLRSALALYESFGFSYAPVPAGTGFVTVDIYMTLDLGA